MRIAIAQIDTVPGELDQTVERMVAQSQRAAEQDVDLLVFPLATLVGVDMVPPADEHAFMWDVADALAELSARLACDAIVPVPREVKGSGDLDFDAQLFSEGETRSLCQYPGYPRGGTGGNIHEVFEFEHADTKMAIAFTYAALDALDDYEYDSDVIIFLSGYSYAQDDPSSAMGADLANARFETDADMTGAWIVGASSVGGYGDQVFSGSSMVLDPMGRPVAVAPAFEEALLVADVCGPSEQDHPQVVKPDLFDAPFHLWQAISLGIRDFARKQGFDDAALLLDGSLGSSVLLALASDALGPLHVHAVVGSSAGASAAACRELAGRLRVDVRSATGALHDFDARDVDELELAKLTRELGALALSSADKTSLALGIGCDGVRAASLCPLGDVLRSDVLDMARVRNTISPLFRRVGVGEADAFDIELADGTSRHIASEHDLNTVDEILMGHVEFAKSLSGLVRDMPDEIELAAAVLRTKRSAELLRRGMPPVLAMSTNTLDEASSPLGLRWQDTHDSLEDELIDSFLTASTGHREHGKSERDPKYSPVPAERPDIDATLSMLRDLVEQGGFMPSELGGFAAPKDGGQGPGAPQSGAWFTPFSEN